MPILDLFHKIILKILPSVHPKRHSRSLAITLIKILVSIAFIKVFVILWKIWETWIFLIFQKVLHVGDKIWQICGRHTYVFNHFPRIFKFFVQLSFRPTLKVNICVWLKSKVTILLKSELSVFLIDFVVKSETYRKVFTRASFFLLYEFRQFTTILDYQVTFYFDN